MQKFFEPPPLNDDRRRSTVIDKTVAGRFLGWGGGVIQLMKNTKYTLEKMSNGKDKNKGVSLGVLIGVCVGLAVFIVGCLFGFRKHRDSRKKRRDRIRNLESRSESDPIGESADVIKFTFDEIKKATGNFSIHKIIGRGGYGNVFKGYLWLRGHFEKVQELFHRRYDAIRGSSKGNCDLIKNESLYDHLFDLIKARLSGPIRQKIALETARGLAYLHHGAQLAIIHRDIKASNILLDDMFEAKVADFGLAKFTPEGMALGFGVMLLELLSGKKALTVSDENRTSVVADWAWWVVKNKKALDIMKDGMLELGPPEVLEKYVLIAVLRSHPKLQCRPSKDQVVKMSETDNLVPSIPDKPIPLVAHIDDIESSIKGNGSCQVSSFGGYHMFSYERNHSNDKEGTSSGSSIEVSRKHNTA
ncbi:Kinase family protein [Hibiscus syriacus]|uniref:non-specific serine/threonine protein kinase n=1 Tax=Hibiscus syriacus TaxID=106335 RepID=A0A6A2Y0G7_HIBSY|nr:Kinase family protein [Hibiscus syriacus]